MNHTISYTDPDNNVTYVLSYQDSNPAQIRISGPRQQDGILIPYRAMEYLLMAYRLHVFHDIFEHRPLPD